MARAEINIQSFRSHRHLNYIFECMPCIDCLSFKIISEVLQYTYLALPVLFGMLVPGDLVNHRERVTRHCFMESGENMKHSRTWQEPRVASVSQSPDLSSQGANIRPNKIVARGLHVNGHPAGRGRSLPGRGHAMSVSPSSLPLWSFAACN